MARFYRKRAAMETGKVSPDGGATVKVIDIN